jgi:DinB superfamily
MVRSEALRGQLARMLAWNEAHVGFDAAVEGLAPSLRGRRPNGFPHSCWELVEHIRLAQHDLLEFCRNPNYSAPRWPEGYWPALAGPPTPRSWDESIAAFRSDREALQAFVTKSGIDLGARIPHGTGQTYLRSVLLAADHTSYHVGQLVAVRRLLGAWPPASSS